MSATVIFNLDAEEIIHMHSHTGGSVRLCSDTGCFELTANVSMDQD